MYTINACQQENLRQAFRGIYYLPSKVLYHNSCKMSIMISISKMRFHKKLSTFIHLQLCIYKTVVNTFLFHQFVVGPDFGYMMSVDHDEPVGVAQR